MEKELQIKSQEAAAQFEEEAAQAAVEAEELRKANRGNKQLVWGTSARIVAFAGLLLA